jgi:DNA repair protein RadC
MTDTPNPVPRRVRELPLPERPRQRLASLGPAPLSSPELLSLLWNGGQTAAGLELASDVLAHHGDLAELSRADLRELARLPGMGLTRAAQVVAAVELGRRTLAGPPAGRWTIRTPRDVADRLLPQMAPLEREELHVLLLNTRNVVLRQVPLYVGNVSTALVRVAELFRDAVRAHAASVIVVHNHPSGDPGPSPDDLHLTAESIAAGRLLDIPVLDHVIVASGGWVSLRDRGVAFDRPRGGR